MAISVKQNIFNQLDTIEQALDYAKSELPELTKAELGVTSDFLLQALEKIAVVKGKVREWLKGQKEVIPAIEDWEVLALIGRTSRLNRAVKEINLQICDPFALRLMHVDRLKELSKQISVIAQRQRSDDLEIPLRMPDLPPTPFRIPRTVLQANVRWLESLQEESDRTNRLIRSYVELLDQLEGGAIDGFEKILRHYQLIKIAGEGPFLISKNKKVLMDLSGKIETCLKQLIDVQEKAESSLASETDQREDFLYFLSTLKNAERMKKRLEEVKSTVLKPKKEEFDGIPSLRFTGIVADPASN